MHLAAYRAYDKNFKINSFKIRPFNATCQLFARLSVLINVKIR